MSNLPYQNSKADPMKAQGRIQAILRKFGVSRIMFDDDIQAMRVVVRFVYKDMPVSFPVNYGDLRKKFIANNPYTERKRISRVDYEFEKGEEAYRATYSMLEDYIKSMISMADLGLYSFEEVFLGFFTDRHGVRLSETIVPKLQGYIDSKFQLTEGK